MNDRLLRTSLLDLLHALGNDAPGLLLGGGYGLYLKQLHLAAAGVRARRGADPHGMPMRKPLCRSPRDKTISWITPMSRAGSAIPDRFTTTRNVAALLVEPAEVLREVDRVLLP